MIFYARLNTATAALDGTDDVQLFPPGDHEVSPYFVDEDGKEVRKTFTVTIDEDVARAIEADRARYQAEADAGKGDTPYLDFNHEDAEASARVEKVYWGGDDPLKGGVRAKVDWSAAGRAALVGKMYRRISPGFGVDNKESDHPRIIGAPVNMGGLVNKAAFRAIAPLFARGAGEQSPPETETNQTKQNNMTDQEIQKLQADYAAATARIKELEDKMSVMAKEQDALIDEDAEQAVAQAVAEGRLEPNDELKAKWKGIIKANKANKDLLAKLPVNPAFAQVYQAKDGKPASDGQSDQALLAQYDKLEGRERAAFFAKNRDQLIQFRGKA